MDGVIIKNWTYPMFYNTEDFDRVYNNMLILKSGVDLLGYISGDLIKPDTSAGRYTEYDVSFINAVESNLSQFAEWIKEQIQDIQNTKTWVWDYDNPPSPTYDDFNRWEQIVKAVNDKIDRQEKSFRHAGVELANDV